MGHISSTTRILSILGVIAVVVAVGYYLFFVEIKKINEKASLLANEMDITVQEEVQLRNLRDVIKNTQSDRNRLDSFFITESGIVNFLGIVEGLEEVTGAEINVRSIGEAVDGTTGFSEDLTLNVSSKGTWEEVYHFFALLESLPYLIQMNQVQLSRSGSADDSPEWLGNFNFVFTKIR